MQRNTITDKAAGENKNSYYQSSWFSSSENIKIETADNTLKVIYDKGQYDSPKEFDYIHRGIARRAFNFGWKISPKCDITKISATMDKGLLSIFIPFTKEATPKPVIIK